MTTHRPIDLSAMISGIQRWVETESPTRDKAAVNRMIDVVQADVAALPVGVERVPGREGFADNLIVRNQAAGHGTGILILSHIDTVHPIGTLAGPLPFRRDGDRLYGPGLFDMKGGAYLALEAFRQVARAGSAKLPVTFLFTPDEEVGLPTSSSGVNRNVTGSFALPAFATSRNASSAKYAPPFMSNRPGP